jgi:hypothetical protein
MGALINSTQTMDLDLFKATSMSMPTGRAFIRIAMGDQSAHESLALGANLNRLASRVTTTEFVMNNWFLHFAWAAFIGGCIAWFSWFYRFVPQSDHYYFDRWTGSVVKLHVSVGPIAEWFSLFDPRVNSSAEFRERIDSGKQGPDDKARGR